MRLRERARGLNAARVGYRNRPSSDQPGMLRRLRHQSGNRTTPESVALGLCHVGLNDIGVVPVGTVVSFQVSEERIPIDSFRAPLSRIG